MKYYFLISNEQLFIWKHHKTQDLHTKEWMMIRMKIDVSSSVLHVILLIMYVNNPDNYFDLNQNLASVVWTCFERFKIWCSINSLLIKL